MKSQKYKLSRILAGVCLAGAMIVLTQAPEYAAPQNTKSNAVVKNVILLISDGGGFNHVVSTDYYQHGKIGTQVYEHFPTQLAVSTYEYEWIVDNEGNPIGYAILGYDTNQAWSDFNYPIQVDPMNPEYINNATDSASAATAMATGVKTRDGAIGVDVNGDPVPNIVEYAESLGKATGVVSSVPFSHATPAGFVAHNASRENYPEIANEMIYASAVDVIMGCSAPDYDFDGNPWTYGSKKYVGGSGTWTDIIDDYSVIGADADADGSADAWTVIRDRAEFQAMALGDTPSRVLGIPKVYQTLQFARSGNGYADPYVVPLNETVPTLEEMTKAALNILDNDMDGFFLMVEGGAVDWASHYYASGRMIEEQIDFNRTVEAVVDWVQKTSNWGQTLVIVTADHETGYLWGPGSGPTAFPMWQPIVNNGQGNMPGMTWNNGSPYTGAWHSNSLVPLFAKGDAARLFEAHADAKDVVRGPYLDNTEIFEIMRYCLK